MTFDTQTQIPSNDGGWNVATIVIYAVAAVAISLLCECVNGAIMGN